MDNTIDDIKMKNIKIFNQSDTPWDFKLYNQAEQWIIEYKNLIEINQGSPLVGRLFVNGKELSKNTLFGSPFIYFDNYIYVPIFIRRLCLSGFILNKINLITHEMNKISKIKNLIYLNSIENNTIIYYTNFDKTNQEEIFLNV
jgi:hypothetical protein